MGERERERAQEIERARGIERAKEIERARERSGTLSRQTSLLWDLIFKPNIQAKYSGLIFRPSI